MVIGWVHRPTNSKLGNLEHLFRHHCWWVILILSKTYGYSGEGAMVAPQANAMASIIKPLMSGESTPWMLYLGGAVLAFILDKLKVPALAFALGMFIPLQLNTPLLVGGAIAWYVTTRSKDEKVNNARKERGTLIASGLIAGGAIMGVVSAILRFANFDFFYDRMGKISCRRISWNWNVCTIVLLPNLGYQKS